MRQNNIKVAVVGFALAIGAPLAHAQTTAPGLYIGGAIGTSDAKEYLCASVTTCDKTGTVGKGFVGYQFDRHFALEIAYADLGTVRSASTTTEETVKVRLGELALLASYPVTERFMAFGKIGGYYANSTATRTTSRLKETSGNVTFGGGLQYYVTANVALRGEYQRYMKVGGGNIGDSDYDTFTAGVLWKFR